MELEMYSRNYPFDDFAAWFTVWAGDLLKNLIGQEYPAATTLLSGCNLNKEAVCRAVADASSTYVLRNSFANVVECETNFIPGDDGQSAVHVRGSLFLLRGVDADVRVVDPDRGSLERSCSDVDDYSGNRIYRSPPVNISIAPCPIAYTRALKLISSSNGNYNNCSTTASEYSKISRELFGFHRHRKVSDKPRLIDFSADS